MHFKRISVIAVSVISLFLFNTSSANAGWFIGTDYTTLGAELGFHDINGNKNSSDLYDFNPIRVKIGYRGDIAGIEVNGYTNQDKTIGSFIGAETNFAMENTYGLYLHLHQKWIYARLGVTWMEATLSFPGTTVSETDSISLPTLAIGAEYKIGKHFFFNLDYTYAEGTGKYPALISGTGRTPITVQGFGLGVNVEF